MFELMKQKTEADLLAEVKHHTIGNRQEIETSQYAECVSCCARFGADEVRKWQDEWTAPERINRVKRWTARCPRCGEPTVIGNSTGLLEDQAYVPIANQIIAKQRQGRANGS